MFEHEFSGNASIISVQQGREGEVVAGDDLVFLRVMIDSLII